MTAPCSLSWSWSLSWWSTVFHFREFNKSISGTWNDFCIIRMRHEFSREYIPHMSYNQSPQKGDISLYEEPFEQQTCHTQTKWIIDNHHFQKRDILLLGSIWQLTIHSSWKCTIMYLHIHDVRLIHKSNLTSQPMSWNCITTFLPSQISHSFGNEKITNTTNWRMTYCLLFLIVREYLCLLEHPGASLMGDLASSLTFIYGRLLLFGIKAVGWNLMTCDRLRRERSVMSDTF
jgi:hypothetical protein